MSWTASRSIWTRSTAVIARTRRAGRLRACFNTAKRASEPGRGRLHDDSDEYFRAPGRDVPRSYGLTFTARRVGIVLGVWGSVACGPGSRVSESESHPKVADV